MDYYQLTVNLLLLTGYYACYGWNWPLSDSDTDSGFKTKTMTIKAEEWFQVQVQAVIQELQKSHTHMDWNTDLVISKVLVLVLVHNS